MSEYLHKLQEWFEEKYRIQENEQDTDYSLILSQIRLLSTKRLHRYIRKVSLKSFDWVLDAFSQLIPSKNI